MADSTGLVHEPEKARPGLKPRFSVNTHEEATGEGSSDVPAQRPEFEITLDAVGICSKPVYVLLPQGRIGFDAEITVDLSSELRGIHMSRMEEAVSELYPQEFRDLRHYGTALAALVLERQEGRICSVTLRGTIPHLWRSCISDRVSVDSVDILAKVQVIRENGTMRFDSSLGLGINHMTACPCTQVYTESLFHVKEGLFPMPTHSQRSRTTLDVQDSGQVLTYDDIFKCLSNSLHPTQDLLKRPDEAEIVLKSHETPQFAEDAVRSVAASCARMFGNLLLPESGIRIESLSLESIHSHNVICRINTTMGAIVNCL